MKQFLWWNIFMAGLIFYQRKHYDSTSIVTSATPLKVLLSSFDIPYVYHTQDFLRGGSEYRGDL